LWEAVEECDDGNAEDADGCDNGCVERFPFVYVTVASLDAMWRYAAETDTWETLDGPGAFYWGGAVFDGTYLYVVADEGALYRYDSSIEMWSYEGDVPGTAASISRLVRADNGLYYIHYGGQAGPPDVRVYRGGVWSTIPLPHESPPSAGWDPVSHELYVRVHGELTLMVIDTLTDQVVGELPNPTAVYDTSRDGAFLDGGIYALPGGGPLTRIDTQTGVTTDTGVTPTSVAPSTAPDLYKRHIYLTGFGNQVDLLERYDADAGTLTTLAPMPVPPQPNWGVTFATVVYPPL
jgi:hypothetical protein